MDGIIATALLLTGAALSLTALLAAERVWSNRRRRRRRRR
jgi:hypothetical protein